MNDRDFIVQELGAPEILAQLAEEVSELAQAALKLRRALTGKNPTPVGVEDATDHVMEEVADAVNCLDLLGIHLENEDVWKIAIAKRKRWVSRICEAKATLEGGNGQSL